MSRAATRYAKALMQLALENNTETAVFQDMNLIVKTIASSKDLENMLQNPIISVSNKKNVLTDLFKSVNQQTKNLFEVLIAKKRIQLLNEAALAYIDLYNFNKGAQIAKVTTATPLTKELETKVIAKVKELTGNTALLENIIDQSILGGFILRIGDIQYNASIAHKLNKLKREFTLN